MGSERGDADPVYVTVRGDAYHDTRDCPALLAGQQGAESQAMHLNPIEEATLAEAERWGKTRCGVCRPAR